MDVKQLRKSADQIHRQIESGNNFAIVISEPDGDSACSGLALYEILTQIKKKTALFSHFPLEEYNYLPLFNKYKITSVCEKDFTKYDAIFILDATSLSRVVDKDCAHNLETLQKKYFIINIDHHEDNTQFGDINYVQAKTSSTAELIYDLFHKKIKLTPSIATNILNGLITDTVCFRQTDVTYPKTLRAAAHLMEEGGDHRWITYHAYYNFDMNLIKANNKTLETLKIKKAGKYTYAYTITDLTRMKDSYPAGEKFVIANEVTRSINGCNFSMRLTPLGKNKTAISLRSRDTEVIKIAEHFGGGGHPEAAGATAQLSMKQVLKELDTFLQTASMKKFI